RHGGNLHELHPYVVSAKMNFDLRRARFGGYRDRAVSLARALATLDGVRLRPELPQTSLFHLLIQGPREKLRAAALAFAERERFWVLGTFFETPDPAISMTEISVGDQAMALSNEEIVGAITQILQDARRS
ncbi:MAG: hypothetical protein ACXWPM_09500, partial [Bdellovibrionota bacterium]